MRLDTIKTGRFQSWSAISIASALFSQFALATSHGLSCNSNLVISLDNSYNASCDCDFSLVGGALQLNMPINLRSNGLLCIGKSASLIAPEINWYSTNISIGTGATIVAGYPLNSGFNNIN